MRLGSKARAHIAGWEAAVLRQKRAGVFAAHGALLAVELVKVIPLERVCSILGDLYADAILATALVKLLSLKVVVFDSGKFPYGQRRPVFLARELDGKSDSTTKAAA